MSLWCSRRLRGYHMPACLYSSDVTSPFLCPFWDFPEWSVDTILNFLAKRKNKLWTGLAYILVRMRISVCGNTYRNLLSVLRVNDVKPLIMSVESRYFLTHRYFLRDLPAALMKVDWLAESDARIFALADFFGVRDLSSILDRIIFLHHDLPHFGVKSSGLFIGSAA
jgi:hypothetical protein